MIAIIFANGQWMPNIVARCPLNATFAVTDRVPWRRRVAVSWEGPMALDVTLRPLGSRDDYAACVRLQHEIWGRDFADVVPATILMVSQRVGGVAAGAFGADGRLLGFVFGISGVRDGAPAHWSDMLAVHPDARRQGLGVRLKRYQRQRLLANGIDIASWSFDPLVAANANLNVNGLGALPVEYVVDMYGDTRSTLHRGLATDRFVVEWNLTGARVERRLAGRGDPLPAAADAAAAVGLESRAPGAELPLDPWVRVAVPARIHVLKATEPALARAWQQLHRRVLPWYLARGYRVAGFRHLPPPDDSWYVLANEPAGTRTANR